MATALIGAGLGLGSSLLGGIFGNRPQRTTFNQNQQQDYSNSAGVDTYSTPWYDDESATLKSILTRLFLNRAFGAEADVSGIVGNQIDEANNASSLRTAGLNQILASRGLLNSPVGANALINEQGFRVGQIAGIRQNAPVLREQLLSSRLNDAAGFFRGLPVGTHNTGTTQQYGSSSGSSSGEQTGSGNMLGGAFASLGSGLGYLAGKGFFGKSPWQN